MSSSLRIEKRSGCNAPDKCRAQPLKRRHASKRETRAATGELEGSYLSAPRGGAREAIAVGACRLARHSSARSTAQTRWGDDCTDWRFRDLSDAVKPSMGLSMPAGSPQRELELSPMKRQPLLLDRERSHGSIQARSSPPTVTS